MDYRRERLEDRTRYYRYQGERQALVFDLEIPRPGRPTIHTTVDPEACEAGDDDPDVDRLATLNFCRVVLESIQDCYPEAQVAVDVAPASISDARRARSADPWQPTIPTFLAVTPE